MSGTFLTDDFSVKSLRKLINQSQSLSIFTLIFSVILLFLSLIVNHRESKQSAYLYLFLTLSASAGSAIAGVTSFQTQDDANKIRLIDYTQEQDYIHHISNNVTKVELERDLRDNLYNKMISETMNSGETIKELHSLVVQLSTDLKSTSERLSKYEGTIEDKPNEVSKAKTQIELDNSKVKFYDFKELIQNTSTGVVIAGDSGSGKTCVAVETIGILTEHKPSEVYVLDPHNNAIWREYGLECITDIHDAERVLLYILKTFEKRYQDDYVYDPEVDHQIILVCDELIAQLSNFGAKAEIVSNLITKIGIEGRKRGITGINITHGTTKEDTNISPQLLTSGYIVFRLGRLCKMKLQFVNSTPELRSYLDDAPYPMVADYYGAIVHPTHSHHKKFKAIGNAPIITHKPRLLENQIRKTKKPTDGNNLISDNSETEDETKEPKQINLSKPVTDSEYPDLSIEQAKVYRYIKSKNGEITLRDLMRSSVISVNDWSWSNSTPESFKTSKNLYLLILKSLVANDYIQEFDENAQSVVIKVK